MAIEALPMLTPLARPLVPSLLGVLLLATSACGGGSDASDDTPPQGCGEVVRERLDPDSLVHILPGGDEPDYLTDPPTSGPHAPTAPVGGLRDETLGRSEQVGLLEAGIVIVQHDDSLPDADVEAIEGLADPERVVVAPNDDLPAPIVATAWTRKLLCTSVEHGGRQALADFVEARAGQAPGSDG
jgi:hypothetical protein